jgi:hypothetical protein
MRPNTIFMKGRVTFYPVSEHAQLYKNSFTWLSHLPTWGMLSIQEELGVVVHTCDPAGRLRQEDHKFKASLGNLAIAYLKIKEKELGSSSVTQ